MKNTILIILGFLFFASCEKEELYFLGSDSPKDSSEHIIFNSNDQEIQFRTVDSLGYSRTILGSIRTNPFTTARMATAHNNLYSTTIQNMTATDLYVKFSPADDEDIQELIDTDEFFYDYPLEYEVVEMGDYYFLATSSTYPDLYAIVDTNFVFPSVPYTIVDDLYLDRSDPLLVAESMRLAGFASDINTYVLNARGLQAADLGTTQQLILPEMIECPPHCIPMLEVDIYTVPVSWSWYCECGYGEEEDDFMINDCGCLVSTDIRKPGGCVNVDDTEFSTIGNTGTFVPAQNVKVVMKDTWFTESSTWTNDEGCWRIGTEFKGVAWQYIVFKNPKTKIRGVAGNWAASYEWLFSIKSYVGKLAGPTFNSIETSFERNADPDSKNHLYYSAAHVVNTVEEFHANALIDGIDRPPYNLDIFIAHNRSSGYALMDAQYTLTANVVASLALISSQTIYGPLVSVVGGVALVKYLPDVMIGIEYDNTDRLKRLAYHELAHASHFSNVGGIYWNNVAITEILALGHGTPNSWQSGLIAVVESWAEFIARSYTHREYGTSNSIGGIGFATYETYLERQRNYDSDYIPVGYYNDLVDPILLAEYTCDGFWANNDCHSNLDDVVVGFNISQMFDCLGAATENPEEFTEALIYKYLSQTSNSEQDAIDLFSEY